MSKHKITWLDYGFTNGMDWEAEYEVTFEYRKGGSATQIDPGYAAEVEAIDIKPEHGTLGSREKADALDKAQMWLDDKGYAAALEIVASDLEAAREYAAELRADR